MKLIAIAVVASNRVIGDGHDQPFKFREDFARFKRVTMGHPLIMGRRTHDIIGLLPGRPSIVITRHPELVHFPADEDGRPRGHAVSSVDEALEVASRLDDVVYVIGGGQVFQQFWSRLDELDMTEVPAAAEGDVLLPEIDPAVWVEVSRNRREEFDFVHYRRRQEQA
ncbi:MAG: dihydrofolate reductase [Brooklawnia sp.]|uniref:dihydrofolate reductase n=1 Tax=Brooklawnia sp. TaxID=2699740 RepID=UPI003C78AA2B